MFDAVRDTEDNDTGLIDNYAYPAEGHDINLWERVVPGVAGLNAEVISEIDTCVKANPDGKQQRWALWA